MCTIYLHLVYFAYMPALHVYFLLSSLYNFIIGPFNITLETYAFSIPPTQSGETPLHIACRCRHNGAINTLVKFNYGADTDLAEMV